MQSVLAAAHVATKHSVLGNLMRLGLMLKESALPAPQLCIRRNSACAPKAVERQLGFHHDAGHLHYPSSLRWLSCQVVQAPSLADCKVPEAREVRLCVALCRHSGYSNHSTSGSNASVQCSAGERTQAAMYGRHVFWMHSSGRDWISRVNFRLQAPSRSQPVTHNLQEKADLGFVGKALNPLSVPLSFGIFGSFGSFRLAFPNILDSSGQNLSSHGCL